MSDAARGLVTLATKRTARDDFELLYLNLEDQYDGSYTPERNVVPVRGFFAYLTNTELQRMFEGGITLKAGAYFTVPFLIETVPYAIRKDDQVFTIIKYSSARGATVFLTDIKTLESAKPHEDSYDIFDEYADDSIFDEYE